MSIPTWEEWLKEHGFTKGERPHGRTINVDDWSRYWPQHGRGWLVRVAPSADTVNIIVYNNTLGQRYHHVAMVSVSERAVVGIVSKMIAEIERSVSDATKKRRLRAFTSAISYEERDDKVEFINGPVLPFTEARPIYRPVPDYPAELSKEQMDQMLDRIQPRCFPKGQRVRVRRPRAGTLTNATGTVVDSTKNACYVAIDHYVEAGDPDPFRFEADELEPLRESADDLDDPKPYIEALDYVTLLNKLGYRLISGTYRKDIPLGDHGGRLKIEVEPRRYTREHEIAGIPEAAAIIYVEFASLVVGEMRRVQDILVRSPFDIVDTVRELEHLAVTTDSIGDFADALRLKHYPGSTVNSREHLFYVFGEGQESLDNPDFYIQDLQRHYGIINLFRNRGVKMGRRMGEGRHFYRLFWIPSAVSDVSYDIYLKPQPDNSWSITASGNKEFQDQVGVDWQEDFDIAREWTIPAGLSEAEMKDIVDDTLSDLLTYKGPEEPTTEGPDVDDIDEGIDDPSEDDDIDYENYIKNAANYNPVQLLSAKDVRKIIKDAGYRINSFYYSKRTTGYSLRIMPGTDEQMQEMKQNPDREAGRVLEAIRQGIVKRLPMLGKVEHGVYNFDDKLVVHCWYWGETRYKDNPDDPRNFLLYVDILPKDYKRRGANGVMLPESVDDPDHIEDLSAYLKATPDAVMVIKDAGYVYAPDSNGHRRWQKFWPLPHPVQRHVQPWAGSWTHLWASPDPWGQLVYALVVKGPDSFRNRADSGIIDVAPVNRAAGNDDTDYATSVRRMLLKVDALGRNIPAGINDPDELRGYVFQGMERIKKEVNAESMPTWIAPGLAEGVAQPDPDDPEAMLQRVRPAKLGELVSLICPVCGDKHEVFKNWPDDAPREWGFECKKCSAHIPVPQVVVEAADGIDDAANYVKTTHDPAEFLKQQGWQPEAEQAFIKIFPLPRHYRMGNMVFTGFKVRLGLEIGAYEAAWIGTYFVDAAGTGFGIGGANLYPQQLQGWDANSNGSPPDRLFDINMPLRRFALGIENELRHVKWPENETAAVLASSQVKQAVDSFVAALNRQAETPLHPEISESIDDPQESNHLLPDQAAYAAQTLERLGFEKFAPNRWRRVRDGVVISVTNQNEVWLVDASIWTGQAWHRYIWNWRWHPEGNQRLEDMIDTVMSTLNKECPAVHESAGAPDPDDPEAALKSHPGFEYRDTSYIGTMVFVKGPGEDTSDWPQDIGRILRGPEGRYYVIGVRGVNPDEIGKYGFGVVGKPKTFDSPDDASLALWLVWSRLNKEQQRGYLLPPT